MLPANDHNAKNTGIERQADVSLEHENVPSTTLAKLGFIQIAPVRPGAMDPEMARGLDDQTGSLRPVQS